MARPQLSCSTCRYAEPTVAEMSVDGASSRGEVALLCRRYPPQVTGVGGDDTQVAVQSPVVSELDWCGEHALADLATLQDVELRESDTPAWVDEQLARCVRCGHTRAVHGSSQDPEHVDGPCRITWSRAETAPGETAEPLRPERCSCGGFVA